MVAFALSPVPSTFITSPSPKRSCSIICPARTPVTDAAFEAADCALLLPLTALTFFRFLGTLGAIICAFGRARCSEELLPKEARDGEAERVKPPSISLRKRPAPSSTERLTPASCGNCK